MEEDEFLRELYGLVEKHKAWIFYTDEDEGINIMVNHKVIFKGVIDGGVEITNEIKDT